MICNELDNVRYCSKDDYYIVGDNLTDGSGISTTSFSEEIVIKEKFREKSVLEIGKNAFINCFSITKITILARIRNINMQAFIYRIIILNI